MKFSSIPNASVQRCLCPLFQNQCPLFFRIYQLSGQDQQNDKETYRWLPPWSFSIEFSIKPVYPTMAGEKCSHLWCSDYWRMHLRVKKLNQIIFTHTSQAKLSPWFLSSPPRLRGITLRELKRWPKLNLRWHWSQVLVNPIIFAPLTFLFTVLLHYNLD